jgi:glucose/arabinose dehydrogenase
VLVLSLACGGGGGSGGGGGGGDAGDASDLALLWVEAFAGLTLTRPVKLVQHPSDDDRWYAVEQGGRVRTFLASDPAATLATAVDVGAAVDLGATTGEQGLLSLAFDPAFAATGEIYLTYTDEASDESVLARYASGDGGLTFAATADPIVLAIPHPRSNHNGGDLAFGPDGFLYYSLGDGGGSNDPDENAQDPTNLLGAVLRLDVRGAPDPGLAYAIPLGNPWQANPACDGGSGVFPCPEIWATGLRNPWRMSFDPVSGELWLGDVGERTREEIDRIVRAGNYGWDCIEGDVPVPGEGAGCDFASFEPPEVVHTWGSSVARAITGGVVYAGTDVPELDRHYVYGDFISGRFWALDLNDPNGPALPLDLPAAPVAAFARDRDGEVYAVVFSNPPVRRLAPAPPP